MANLGAVAGGGDNDNVDDDDDDDDQQGSTSAQTQPSRRLVRRRTRRVRTKLRGRNRQRANEGEEDPIPASQESQMSGNQALQDNPPNRHLKYVVENLRARQNSMDKAQFILTYFSNCSFNAALSPDGIIRFSDAEAVELSRYVQELDEGTGDIEEPQVCIS